MKKKPKYRIIEVKDAKQSAPEFYIQKRVWFWWVYVVYNNNSLRHGERVKFITIPAAESYINYHLNFKPYKKIVKEIY